MIFLILLNKGWVMTMDERSREHRRMKKEQEKSEKGAKGEKLKGAGSKRGNCLRSREHGAPLTEAHFLCEDLMNDIEHC